MYTVLGGNEFAGIIKNCTLIELKLASMHELLML